MEDKTKKLLDSISIAVKSAPPPPTYLPDNICVNTCHVCYNEWFEDTIIMFHCQCRKLRLCPTCALSMIEPACMEHNMIDCNYEEEEEEECINWVESLGGNIIESLTLEIGNPIDGHNYIKQVITKNELKNNLKK